MCKGKTLFSIRQIFHKKIIFFNVQPIAASQLPHTDRDASLGQLIREPAFKGNTFIMTKYFLKFLFKVLDSYLRAYTNFVAENHLLR